MPGRASRSPRSSSAPWRRTSSTSYGSPRAATSGTRPSGSSRSACPPGSPRTPPTPAVQVHPIVCLAHTVDVQIGKPRGHYASSPCLLFSTSCEPSIVTAWSSSGEYGDQRGHWWALEATYPITRRALRVPTGCVPWRSAGSSHTRRGAQSPPPRMRARASVRKARGLSSAGRPRCSSPALTSRVVAIRRATARHDLCG
jgi:hypothetical protein